MQKLVIVGTGSTANTIHEFILKYSLYEVIGFAVNRDYLKEDRYRGLPVFSIEELETVIDIEKDLLFVAVQWNNLNGDRRRMYESLRDAGFKFANLVSPTAIVHGTIEGDNCWITDLAIIDFGAIVKSNVYIKQYAFIAHGATIRDHCFIGVNSTIGGLAEIGEQSFVGISATILDEVRVGRKCIVGAGTVLKRNLADFSAYKTTGENYTAKQYTEDVIESKLRFSKNVR